MSRDVVGELRAKYEAATKGRSVRLLALTGGMAGECLLEFGDPTNGGRSIQIRKADALLDEAMHRHLPALLEVAEAARELQYQGAVAGPFEDQLERAFEGLDKALSALTTDEGKRCE